MKFDRSALLTILYGLFTILYTSYIITHPGSWRHITSSGSPTSSPRLSHPAHITHPALTWYFAEFLFFGNLAFFILQGLVLKSTNWGIVLLLPLANLIAVIILTYLFVFIIRWGKGDLLNHDGPDMILASIIIVTLSIVSLRWIRPKGMGKHKKPIKSTR